MWSRLGQSAVRRPPKIHSLRRWQSTSNRFGSYQVLEPSLAMTSYPDPRPVSTSIPRPTYVPVNFFTAGWGYHDPVDPLDNSRDAVALGTDEEKRVRAAGKLAAEILANVKRHIKVSLLCAELE